MKRLDTLPLGWWRGLRLQQISPVLAVESCPADQLARRYGCPTRHRDGYTKLQLGRAHPYANSSGQQYLHRYLVMRRRGQLPTDTVVHHDNGARLDTTDTSALLAMDRSTHSRMHWWQRAAGWA